LGGILLAGLIYNFVVVEYILWLSPGLGELILDFDSFLVNYVAYSVTLLLGDPNLNYLDGERGYRFS